MAVMMVAGVVVFAPVAALTWRVETSALPYIAASAACELGYFAFLAAAYRASSVSLVYPVARGTAPVLVLLGAVVVLARPASAGEIVGVVTVAVGILLVRGVRAAAARVDARGFVLAIVTGVFIAGYTLIDKQGVEHAAPITYIELVLVLPALVYALAVARVRGRATLASEARPRVAATGVVLFGTYVLVLYALRLAPAASVSAVRETSVVIAAGIVALTSHERVGAVRLVGAGLVASGIALVALTS
jgi:drug/metabolite transporter (DMT)-like permease